MLNLNSENPLVNCVRAFPRHSSHVFLKRKCEVCWDVHLFSASEIELREMTRGCRRNCLQSADPTVLSTYITLQKNFLIFLCTPLELRLRINMTYDLPWIVLDDDTFDSCKAGWTFRSKRRFRTEQVELILLSQTYAICYMSTIQR